MKCCCCCCCVQVLQALERSAEVIDATSVLLGLRPKDPTAVHQRAKAYYALKNYRRAVADFRLLLTLRKGEAAIFNLLGTALAAMGRSAQKK